MGNSAGRVGSGNEGKTDSGRGSVMNFPYSKAGRKTGKTGGSGSKKTNTNTVDGNKRTVKDPRLA